MSSRVLIVWCFPSELPRVVSHQCFPVLFAMLLSSTASRDCLPVWFLASQSGIEVLVLHLASHGWGSLDAGNLMCSPRHAGQGSSNRDGDVDRDRNRARAPRPSRLVARECELPGRTRVQMWAKSPRAKKEGMCVFGLGRHERERPHTHTCLPEKRVAHVNAQERQRQSPTTIEKHGNDRWHCHHGGHAPNTEK